MVPELVLCPSCGSDDVVKHGPSEAGKQRYKCRNADFSLYLYPAIQLSGLFTGREATDRRYDPEWQWHPGYSPSIED